MSTTFSEKLFEEYLSYKGLIRDKDFFYEPNLGKPRKPDYLIKDGVDTLFEVKEFSRESKSDTKLRASANSRMAVRLDPYARTRKKIDYARQKFKDYKNEYPCVLILHQGDSFTADMDIKMVAASAYGDLAIRWLPHEETSSWFFDKNGALSPLKNTTLSAIAVIEEIFPERAMAEKEFWKKHSMPRKMGSDFLKKYKVWCKSKSYDLQKRYIRLRTIINPFASKPVSINFFTQKYPTYVPQIESYQNG
jgi:hypothetical protein